MIFNETPDRYVLFPIKDNAIWSMYKKQVDSFWRAEEVDVSKDLQDWPKLSTSERDFILKVLAFFAASDGIVMENLAVRFMSDVQLAEARAFYGFQIAMENIHSEMYSILIDTFGGSKKQELFQAISNDFQISRKAQWAQKWIRSESADFSTRLVAFACVEGIFFSGSFASIYWIKKRGLMPGLTLSNEFISRDEALHTEFAVYLYSTIKKSLHAVQLIKEASDLEVEFMKAALPVRMIGMNQAMMTDYIRFVTDRLLLQLGYSKEYNVPNPFAFMELISLDSKANFFERTVSAYALADTSGKETAFDHI
jgi:ribonucleotide reductase beta subunit family protein with ferritin-like domain